MVQGKTLRAVWSGYSKLVYQGRPLLQMEMGPAIIHLRLRATRRSDCPLGTGDGWECQQAGNDLTITPLRFTGCSIFWHS